MAAILDAILNFEVMVENICWHHCFLDSAYFSDNFTYTSWCN